MKAQLLVLAGLLAAGVATAQSGDDFTRHHNDNQRNEQGYHRSQDRSESRHHRMNNEGRHCSNYGNHHGSDRQSRHYSKQKNYHDAHHQSYHRDGRFN